MTNKNQWDTVIIIYINNYSYKWYIIYNGPVYLFSIKTYILKIIYWDIVISIYINYI